MLEREVLELSAVTRERGAAYRSLNVLAGGVDLLRARLIRREAQENFAENAYHKYGRTIADAFLIGYSEKLWGVPADKLTPAVSGGG